MHNQRSHKDNLILGCSCAVLATFLYVCMNVAGKLLVDDHHPIEIVFYRFAIPLIPLFIFMICQKEKKLFRTEKPWGLLVRCACGVLAMGSYMSAIQFLPLADAKVVAFASSLFAPMIAYFILKEYVGLKRWSAIFIGFGGVILVAGPTGNLHPIGMAFALSTAVFDAGMITSLRYLKQENALTITFYLSLFGSIATGLCMPFIAAPILNVTELLLMLAVCLCGTFAQLAMTYASRFAPSSLVAPFMYSSLIWSIIFDITIWTKIPTWTVLIGAVIIMSANLFILYREHINAKQPKR